MKNLIMIALLLILAGCSPENNQSDAVNCVVKEFQLQDATSIREINRNIGNVSGRFFIVKDYDGSVIWVRTDQINWNQKVIEKEWLFMGTNPVRRATIVNTNEIAILEKKE